MIVKKQLLLVYIVCGNLKQAKEIGRKLMEKRLCACVNIFPQMQSMFFWPPKSDVIDGSNEVVLIAKTIEEKYEELEKEAIKLHSYDTPCILAIPIVHVSEKYYRWFVGELGEKTKK